MSGRRKGLEGEREAVRALRRALRKPYRVHHVKRERRAPRDVDAVIVGFEGERAFEVQIRRREDAPQRILGWAAFVGAGRVLVYRMNREPWRVVYDLTGDGAGWPLVKCARVVRSLARFAADVRAGVVR